MSGVRTEHDEQCLCPCGCGRVSRPAPRTDRQKGWVKGQPLYIRGHHHARWRYVDDSGHVRLYAPWHPNASSSGHVFEHVVVAVRALRKPLPPAAEVHHVNEDPADNRPSNLVICEDHTYHFLLHARMRALQACGNPDHRACVRCGRWSHPDEMLRHDRYTFVHSECRKQYMREWRARRSP